jgi:hypothetical protein
MFHGYNIAALAVVGKQSIKGIVARQLAFSNYGHNYVKKSGTSEGE